MTKRAKSTKRTKRASSRKLIETGPIPGMAKRVPGDMGKTVPGMKW